MPATKKLSELTVADLKKELEASELDTAGLRRASKTREDSDSFLFSVPCSVEQLTATSKTEMTVQREETGVQSKEIRNV